MWYLKGNIYIQTRERDKGFFDLEIPSLWALLIWTVISISFDCFDLTTLLYFAPAPLLIRVQFSKIWFIISVSVFQMFNTVGQINKHLLFWGQYNFLQLSAIEVHYGVWISHSSVILSACYFAIHLTQSTSVALWLILLHFQEGKTFEKFYFTIFRLRNLSKCGKVGIHCAQHKVFLITGLCLRGWSFLIQQWGMGWLRGEGGR